MPTRALSAVGAERGRVHDGARPLPGLDPDLPATLSARALAIAREYLGPAGCVLSDDLEMKAIADRWSIEASAVRAHRGRVRRAPRLQERGAPGAGGGRARGAGAEDAAFRARVQDAHARFVAMRRQVPPAPVNDPRGARGGERRRARGGTQDRSGARAHRGDAMSQAWFAARVVTCDPARATPADPLRHDRGRRGRRRRRARRVDRARAARRPAADAVVRRGTRRAHAGSRGRTYARGVGRLAPRRVRRCAWRAVTTEQSRRRAAASRRARARSRRRAKRRSRASSRVGSREWRVSASRAWR